MKYIVKNFRGISEATLEGEGIILVSGRNRAGKTSLVAGQLGYAQERVWATFAGVMQLAAPWCGTTRIAGLA